jgi:microsomal dipeptidase-like Zn-dependent dipeptidase
MGRIFDLHFHLLLKHYLGQHPNGQDLGLDDKLQTKGVTKVINDVLGGAFDSQSSPHQVGQSQLYLGVSAILSLEHAFANRVLQVLGHDLSRLLPIKQQLFRQIKAGELTYYQEFINQTNQHLQQAADLAARYHIEFLHRAHWQGKTREEISQALTTGTKRYLAFSIEGGHNLSDVPIRQETLSRNPEQRLKAIQDRTDVDFLYLSLCHLSFIPEQPLGGFAQGVNKLSRVAFSSEDFMPKNGLGLTEAGKKVIRQALTHKARPILIDVKHMSLYTRLHYYQYRDELALKYPATRRLPVISTHTGFTFYTLAEYLEHKPFRSESSTEAGLPVSRIAPENRRIGRTNDLFNKRLFCNSWTINLFDEEIAEIMESGGMIGLSLDQRILGVSNPALDSIRDKYFEPEYIARPEWEKLFRDGQQPGAAETLLPEERIVLPARPERHIMLLCLHLIHAVRVGYENLNWLEGSSPWDHLCIGSDFDGLINPINGVGDVVQLNNIRSELKTWLPQADKFLLFNPAVKALRYNADGTVNQQYLDQVIEKFVFQNGLHFMARFLSNWS